MTGGAAFLFSGKGRAVAMKIECPNCNFTKSTTDDRVLSGGVFAICPKCQTRFEIVVPPRPAATVVCPKCESRQEEGDVCRSCGIVFSKYNRVQEKMEEVWASGPGPVAKPQRSTFVNVLAWIFIVLGGFATFMSVLQNIMIRMMFRQEEMAQTLQKTESSKQMPALANFMFSHINLFFLFFLLIAAASLISAVALLKRKNWARVVFIHFDAVRHILELHRFDFAIYHVQQYAGNAWQCGSARIYKYGVHYQNC
jgi:hypothetical protein